MGSKESTQSQEIHRKMELLRDKIGQYNKWLDQWWMKWTYLRHIRWKQYIQLFISLTKLISDHIVTSTYCKNSDVLFAALWTKLSILSQNRGNLKKKNSCCPITSVLLRWCLSCHVNVSLATLTSLLPRFPLEHLSCHIFEDVCHNCHVNVGLATFSTGTFLLPRL